LQFTSNQKSIMRKRY